MDGVIGSPSPDRALAGRAHWGAACWFLPTAHRPSRTAHGPIVTSGPHVTVMMKTIQRTSSISAMVGAPMSVQSLFATASMMPRSKRPPAPMPSPAAMPLAASMGAVSRSMRRRWRSWRKRCPRSSHSVAASMFPAASAARSMRSYREAVRPSHVRRATMRVPPSTYRPWRAVARQAVLVVSCVATVRIPRAERTHRGTGGLSAAGVATAAVSTGTGATGVGVVFSKRGTTLSLMTERLLTAPTLGQGSG